MQFCPLTFLPGNYRVEPAGGKRKNFTGNLNGGLSCS
jgi:hypothetical protein